MIQELFKKKPFIDLFIDGTENPIQVLVDTGFTGELALTERTINELRLLSLSSTYIESATNKGYVSLYQLNIKWFQQTISISAIKIAGQDNLIGIGLLEKCDPTLKERLLTLNFYEDKEKNHLIKIT